MRADMGKVLVERPRPGSREGSRPRKGYFRDLRRAMENDDGGTTREGIRRRYSSRRFFNEHLGPLRRFIASNVGRPWDKVYAEICEQVDRGNVVQKHILTHLFDYVVTETVLVNGVPCLGKRMWPCEYGQPLRDVRTYSARWYVCPSSGLLRAFKRQRYEYGRQHAPKEPRVHRLSETLAYRVVASGVELIRLAPLPENWIAKAGFDVVLNRRWSDLGASQIQHTYGRLVYAVDKWVASKKELRQYPVPFELTR